MYAVGLAIAGFIPLLRLIDVKSIPLLVITSLITGIGAGICSTSVLWNSGRQYRLYRDDDGIRAEGAVAALPVLFQNVQWELEEQFRDICFRWQDSMQQLKYRHRV